MERSGSLAAGLADDLVGDEGGVAGCLDVGEPRGWVGPVAVLEGCRPRMIALANAAAAPSRGHAREPARWRGPKPWWHRGRPGPVVTAPGGHGLPHLRHQPAGGSPYRDRHTMVGAESEAPRCWQSGTQRPPQPPIHRRRRCRGEALEVLARGHQSAAPAALWPVPAPCHNPTDGTLAVDTDEPSQRRERPQRLRKFRCGARHGWPSDPILDNYEGSLHPHRTASIA